MKNKTLLIFTITFILTTFIYIGIQHRRINRLQDENQLKAVELSTLKDTVEVYQSKNGELTYKLNVIEVKNSTLKKSLELVGFDIQKLKEKDIAWRKVTAALRMQLTASGSGETTVTDTFRIEKTDTVYFSDVEDWSNNHLTLFNSTIENSKLFFDYQYKTGISIIQESKRKETLVSVMLTDPNASITTANSITIKHPKKLWQKPWLWAVVGFAGGAIITK
jgi:hypothetical protein